MFFTKKLDINSNQRNEMINVSRLVDEFLQECKLLNGFVTIFIPHTTAAVTINENADPDVKGDMLFSLNKISPLYSEFHHMEGNSDAHVKASIIGNSELIPVIDGKMQLGIWQGIYFCEFDGPRHRKAILTISD